MRILGHPIHPMLVHFPVAFWAAAAVAYMADAAGMSESAALAAKLSNGIGLVMALAAMAAGLLELRSIDNRSEAMRVATRHMLVMGTAWVCFLFALLLPISAGGGMAPATARLAAALSAGGGFVLMGLGGWLGGRLVYEFGVGVRNRPGS